MQDPRRRFTIADGMILVAATAASMVDLAPLMPGAGMARLPWAVALPRLVVAGLAFTIALIPIRLIRPRPDRDDLWRRPGWASCVAVAIALGVSVSQQLLTIATDLIRLPSRIPGRVLLGREAAIQFLQDTLLRNPMHAVIAIAATWAVLALGGRWESDPGWIDRAGRALGAYWIVIGLVDWSSALFA